MNSQNTDCGFEREKKSISGRQEGESSWMSGSCKKKQKTFPQGTKIFRSLTLFVEL